MAHGRSSKSRRTSVDDELPTPPDGGWGWVVVFASFMIHIVADGITYSFGIFYVEFLEVFQEGHAKTAWVASVLVGVTLGSGPISSAFVTKYGCRAVTMGGGLLAGTCLAISIYAQNVMTLLCTIGLGAGLGFGMIYLPAIVSVTMYFEKYRSLATGIAVCGSGFGTFLFAPLTDYLVQNYGWKGAMLLMGGIVYNCVFFGTLFRPLEHPKRKEEPIKTIQLKKKTYKIKRSNSAGHSMDDSRMEIMRLAQSQPSLGSITSKKSDHSGNSALHRMDIFFQGSFLKMAMKQSQQGIPEEMRLMDESGTLRRDALRRPSVKSTKEEKCFGWFSEYNLENFREMMDYTLFADPVFLLFLVSNFATSIGFNAPYVYITSQAKLVGLTNEEGSYLLSVIGIANTLGRIVLGYLSDKAWVNRLFVYNMCLTICGIGTAFSTYVCFDFYSMSAYAALFGFTIGAYVGLTSVILVDLLGLDKLTNAFGLLLLFQGIASLVGPPLVGMIYDYTGSYEYGFILAGVSIGVSGAMLFFIPPVQRIMAKRKLKHQNTEVAIGA